MPLAAVMTAPHQPIVLQELPSPIIEPGGVLLETIHSEVCGTDVHLWHGKLSGVPYPIICGHVSVGRILETGGLVTDLSGNALSVGDVVTFLDVHETCHNCWYCLVAKSTTRCPNRRVYGITYSANDGLLGGWCEQIYLKPGVKILRLPENTTPRQVIAGGCGLPTAIHAIERAQIQLGDNVVIQGSGPVGLNAAILALICGAGQVILIGDPDLRLKLAREFGVDTVISVSQTTSSERIARVKSLTGWRGADVTIEATGAPIAIPEGMELTRDGGRYVVVGQYTDSGEIPINPHTQLNKKHLEIRGCWGSDYSHFDKMLRILARFGERFNWERMISKEYDLSELNEALADVAAGRVVKAVVTPAR
jgi:threonine dehydrogenase-like Zn-dependent dehydrogenase